MGMNTQQNSQENIAVWGLMTLLWRFKIVQILSYHPIWSMGPEPKGLELKYMEMFSGNKFYAVVSDAER